MTSRSPWTLNKLLVLVLAITFLGLTGELRYEHVDRVRRHWTAWIPIVYSAVMFVLCLVCVLLWSRIGRSVLFVAFSVGIVVGGLGFWLHNGKHLGRNLGTVIDAWTQYEHLADTPPALAPLTFCGLGALGMLACAARFQPEPLLPAQS